MRARSDIELFAGDDDGQVLGDPARPWIIGKMREAYGEVLHSGKKKLIDGTIGGRRDAVVEVLGRMVAEFRRMDTWANLNMPVFNRCAYDAFEESRILCGAPFTSRFRAYERSGNFCIRHK